MTDGYLLGGLAGLIVLVAGVWLAVGCQETEACEQRGGRMDCRLSHYQYMPVGKTFIMQPIYDCRCVEQP